MATLPVMGYVLGGALATPWVAQAQQRWGRKISFLQGLGVACGSALLCAYAAQTRQFWLLVAGTVLAGYYSANGQLYRFAAAELCAPQFREKAVSLVLAGGLVGAVAGPNLATHARLWLGEPFVAAYLGLAVLALLGMAFIAAIGFAPPADGASTAGGQSGVLDSTKTQAHVAGVGAVTEAGRSVRVLLRQPVFLVACAGSALGYGVMNLIMAATPLAMQVCGMPFSDSALVLEWHVIGMFAPGFFTGHFIKRFGALPIMGVGVVLNLACVAVALSGLELSHFLLALFMLGVGWNFLFTGSTTLGLTAYAPEEKDRAQAAINFLTFAVMALTSFASGALLTSQGWFWLNTAALLPIVMLGAALLWLGLRKQRS